MQHLVMAFVSLVSTLTLAAGWTLYTEPSPLVVLEMRVESPVVIGEPLVIHVKAKRTKLCPLLIEREFVTAEGTVVAHVVERRYDRGRDDFSYEYAMPTPTISPGLVKYRSRIGTQCNFIQEKFPQWGDWRERDLEFVEG